MKKLIISYICLMWYMSTISAQIGINTETPQRIIHVDGKGNTSGATNVLDDVVVDANGNVGVGTLTPTAKLHIDSGTGLAMRLQDGTQGANKMLYSKDANGNLSWTNQPSSSAVIYYANTGRRAFRNRTSNLLISIPIKETGNYLVFIRWWGIATTTYAPMKHISAYIFLNQANTAAATDQGANKDGVEHYVSYPVANTYFSFTTSLFGAMTAGTYMKIFVNPSTPTTEAYDWIIGSVNTAPQFNPSIIVFKI